MSKIKSDRKENLPDEEKDVSNFPRHKKIESGCKPKRKKTEEATSSDGSGQQQLVAYFLDPGLGCLVIWIEISPLLI